MSEESNEENVSKASNNGDEMLGVDKLSVDYDYLMYKISDYVNSIRLQTHEVVQRQNELIGQGIIEGVVESNVKSYQKLLEKCHDLEMHLDMLEQISVITGEFDKRLKEVVTEYKLFR